MLHTSQFVLMYCLIVLTLSLFHCSPGAVYLEGGLGEARLLFGRLLFNTEVTLFHLPLIWIALFLCKPCSYAQTADSQIRFCRFDSHTPHGFWPRSLYHTFCPRQPSWTEISQNLASSCNTFDWNLIVLFSEDKTMRLEEIRKPYKQPERGLYVFFFREQTGGVERCRLPVLSRPPAIVWERCVWSAGMNNRWMSLYLHLSWQKR